MSGGSWSCRSQTEGLNGLQQGHIEERIGAREREKTTSKGERGRNKSCGWKLEANVKLWIEDKESIRLCSKAVSPVCRFSTCGCVAWEVNDETVGACCKRARTALAVVSSM
jgi:hypothetical protein